MVISYLQRVVFPCADLLHLQVYMCTVIADILPDASSKKLDLSQENPFLVNLLFDMYESSIQHSLSP